MRSENEIKAALWYWEGVIDGLKASSKEKATSIDLSGKADTAEKKVIEAEVSVMRLSWVLGEAGAK